MVKERKRLIRAAQEELALAKDSQDDTLVAHYSAEISKLKKVCRNHLLSYTLPLTGDAIAVAHPTPHFPLICTALH